MIERMGRTVSFVPLIREGTAGQQTEVFVTRRWYFHDGHTSL